MKKLLILSLLVMVIVIAGCKDIDTIEDSGKDLEKITGNVVVCNKPYILVGIACCLDINNNAICDRDEAQKEEKDKEPEQKTEDAAEEETTKEEKPEIEEEYTLFQLKSDINSILGTSYSFKKYPDFENEEFIEYHKANSLGYIIIEVITDESYLINSYKDFVEFSDKYGFEFVGNKNVFGNLTKELPREYFENKADYFNYRTNSLFWTFNYLQREIKTDNGKLIEFIDSLDTYSQFGYFQDGYLNYILKIYCAPDKIVILRAYKPQNYRMMMTGQKEESLWKNTLVTIDEIRLDLIPKAQEILKKCPVDNEFFDTDYELKETKKKFNYVLNRDVLNYTDIEIATDLTDLSVLTGVVRKEGAFKGAGGSGGWILIWW